MKNACTLLWLRQSDFLTSGQSQMRGYEKSSPSLCLAVLYPGTLWCNCLIDYNTHLSNTLPKHQQHRQLSLEDYNRWHALKQVELALMKTTRILYLNVCRNLHFGPESTHACPVFAGHRLSAMAWQAQQKWAPNPWGSEHVTCIRMSRVGWSKRVLICVKKTLQGLCQGPVLSRTHSTSVTWLLIDYQSMWPKVSHSHHSKSLWESLFYR